MKMKIKRSLIKKIREARNQGMPDQEILSMIERSGGHPDVTMSTKVMTGAINPQTGSYYSPTDAVEGLLGAPPNAIIEDAGVTPTAPISDNMPDAQMTPGANRPEMKYDPNLGPAARSMGREVASNMAGGVAGSLVAGIPGAGPFLAPLAAGGTYAGVNKLMGGDPTALDTVAAAVSPIGGMLSKAGSRLPGYIAQPLLDVGVQEAGALLGQRPTPTWTERILTGGTSAGGEFLGGRMEPGPVDVPQELTDAMGRVNQARQGRRVYNRGEAMPTISQSQATRVLPMASSDFLGDQSYIQSQIGKLEQGLSAGLPGRSDPAKEALVLQTLERELLAQTGEMDEARRAYLRRTLETMTPMQRDSLIESLRAAREAAPPYATVDELSGVLGQIGRGQGLNPRYSPENLGRLAQEAIGPKLEATRKEIGKAYEGVFDPLKASNIPTDPTELDAVLKQFDEEFSTYLPSAKGRFKPATSDAAAMRGQMQPGDTGLLDASGRPIQSPPQPITLGKISQAIKDVNYDILKTPRTEANRGKFAAMYDFKRLMEEQGDKAVERIGKVTPNDPDVANWQKFKDVRRQYRGAMDDLRAFDELPTEAAALGGQLAKGRNLSEPNKAYDIVERFLQREGGKTSIGPRAKEAAIYSRLEKPASMNMIEEKDIRGLLSVPGIKPEEARVITKFADEVNARKLPQAPEEFLDMLVPLAGKDVGATGRQVLSGGAPERTDRAWAVLDKMNPAQATEIRNAAYRRVLERASSEGRFNPAEFDRILAANSSSIRQNDLKRLVKLGGALMNDAKLAALDGAELIDALRIVKNSNSATELLNGFSRVKSNNPVAAQNLITQIGNSPGNKKLFQEVLFESITDSPSTDPAERLLDIAQRLRDLRYENLTELLDPKQVQMLRDYDTIISHAAPLLQNEVRTGKGVARSVGSTGRQAGSFVGFLQAGASNLLRATVGGAAAASVAPTLFIPAFALTFLAPKVVSRAILAGEGSIAKTLQQGAAAITRGTTAGMKSVEREMTRKESAQ